MNHSKNIISLLAAMAFVLVTYGAENDTVTVGSPDDYESTVAYGDGFLASHGNGWIDFVSVDGDVLKHVKAAEEPVADMTVCANTIYVSTIAGEVLKTENLDDFERMSIGNDTYARCMTSFEDYVIMSAASDGVLVIDRNGECWRIELSLKGNVVALSSGTKACYGVTDEGEILRTLNGTDWSVVDFNELYAGFYPLCSFTGVSVTPRRIALIGVDKMSGEPLLFGSTEGEVWNQMRLDFKSSDGQTATLYARPNEIAYDTVGDRFLIVCDDGQLVYVPACSHCNHAVKLSDGRLASVAINGNTLMVVGANGYVETFDDNW